MESPAHSRTLSICPNHVDRNVVVSVRGSVVVIICGPVGTVIVVAESQISKQSFRDVFD